MNSVVIPVPSLSLDGWVVSTAGKADYLISHFFLSEFSQTHIYLGNVSSLPYIIQKNQNDPAKTVIDLRDTLTRYFSKYFENVNVEANATEDAVGGTKYTIRLFVSFTDNDGIVFSLSRAVDVLDSKIEKIATLNNTGPSF